MSGQPDIPEIDVHEAKARVDGGALFLDVREEDEFHGILGHITGATLIPLGDLTDHAKELDADKPVVTVCRSGARSAQATVLLAKAGLEKVANLAGGMLRWRAQRLPVEAA